MAYTNIDDPSAHFHIQLYTGNDASDRDITNDANAGDFKPDWLWLKNRTDNSTQHFWFNSNVGMPNHLYSDSNDPEQTATNKATAFNDDGFRIQSHSQVNGNGKNYVAWQWKGGSDAPTKTYKVVVVSDSGNKYRFRNSADSATFAQSAVTIDLQEGGTYVFDWSDSTAQGHPIRFSLTSDGTHGGGSEYTTGVVKDDSAYKTTITVASGVATLYYYCSNHSGMGGQVNTNATKGSSNFDGDIQSVSQENTTGGFSIVRYTGNGTGSTQTVGHGLGAECRAIFLKMRTDAGDSWRVFHENGSQSAGGNLFLNGTSGLDTGDPARITSTNSTTFTLTAYSSPYDAVNSNNKNYIAYCFADVKGYSKFGSYTGNGNSDGTFIYTGFKPAWFLTKRTNSTSHWTILDGTRNSFNVAENYLHANETDAENTNNQKADFLSNGIKLRSTSRHNDNGSTFVYWAFASLPFVSSKGVPTTAR